MSPAKRQRLGLDKGEKRSVKVDEAEGSSSPSKAARTSPTSSPSPAGPVTECQTGGPGGSHPPTGDRAPTAVTVEDVVVPPSASEQDARDISSVSLEVLAEQLPSEISAFKQELMSLEEVYISSCYRNKGVDITEEEVRQIALMSVELGSSHIVEMFSPKRFNAMASRLGLRPGFSVDLTEAKPYGPHAGECWDLSKDEDVRELEEMIDYEAPAYYRFPSM